MESVSAVVQSMTNLFNDFFFAWGLPPLTTAGFLGCSTEEYNTISHTARAHPRTLLNGLHQTRQVHVALQSSRKSPCTARPTTAGTIALSQRCTASGMSRTPPGFSLRHRDRSARARDAPDARATRATRPNGTANPARSRSYVCCPRVRSLTTRVSRVCVPRPPPMPRTISRPNARG